MAKGKFGVAVILLALLLFARPASAIVFGQFDTFQDGSTNEWTNGPFAIPVTNINGGGPGGAGDRYIRITADGSGAGGRLTTFNFTTWTGDFISAGITTLEIDLLNQSAVTLSIRFAFEVDVQQNAPGYLTPPMVLSVGSGWQHFSVSITAANLIPVGGPPPYNTFFSNIMETRIIHSVGTSNLMVILLSGNSASITSTPFLNHRSRRSQPPACLRWPRTLRGPSGAAFVRIRFQ
jgi:hypothetical protein